MGTVDGLEFLINKLKESKSNSEFFDAMEEYLIALTAALARWVPAAAGRGRRSGAGRAAVALNREHRRAGGFAAFEDRDGRGRHRAQRDGVWLIASEPTCSVPPRTAREGRRHQIVTGGRHRGVQVGRVGNGSLCSREGCRYRPGRSSVRGGLAERASDQRGARQSRSDL